MAPPRSASLQQLAANIFEDDGTEEALGAQLKGDCGFARSLSEDSTLPGQPFSRVASQSGSDDEPVELQQGTLAAAPAAAKLLKGAVADPGPEVPPWQELIAVRPDGAATYVPEDQAAGFIVLRSLAYDPSPLVLVARDGTAYYVEDGDNVDWGSLKELPAGAPDPEKPRRPSPAALQPRRPLEPSDEDLTVETQSYGPQGSVPRSPSIKKLTQLLFEGAHGPRTAGVDVDEVDEELELEGQEFEWQEVEEPKLKGPPPATAEPDSGFGCSVQ